MYAAHAAAALIPDFDAVLIFLGVAGAHTAGLALLARKVRGNG